MKLATIVFFAAYMSFSSVVYSMDQMPTDGAIEKLCLDLSAVDLSGQDYASLPQELQLVIFTSMGPLAIYEIWWQRIICKGWYMVIVNNAKSIRERLKISPLCMAAAFGDVEKMVALKLDDRCSLRQPDEHGLRAIHFAMTAEQHGCMKLLMLGMACDTTLQDVESLKDYVPNHDGVTLGLLTYAREPNCLPHQLLDAIEAHDLVAFLGMLLKDPSLGFRCDIQYLERAELVSDEFYRFLKFIKQACFEHWTLDHMNDILEDPIAHFSEFNLCGANPNVYNEEGYAFLHLTAMDSEYLPLLEELIKCDGINTDIRTIQADANNFNGLTALHVAAASDASECLQALLKSNLYGVNIVSNDLYKVTPMHCAALEGALNSIQLLVNYQADLNIEDSFGETPMDCAVFGGHFEAVKLLHSYGAIMRYRNKLGKTALDYAPEKGHQEIVDFFNSLS